MRPPLPDRDDASDLRFLPAGCDGLLVEARDLEETLALFEALTHAPVAGIQQIVPAARTLLITRDPSRLSQDALIEAVRRSAGRSQGTVAGPTVDIPMVYDGEDLADVARLTGLGVDEVARRHEAGDYVVAFTGFAPGFAYLSGGDPRLHVSRRPSPRTRVPAGSVGLAGEFSGVYPKDSPGGWQLIGRTPLVLFDIAREPPSLLQPGCRVRFRAVRDARPYEIAPRAAPKPAPAQGDAPLSSLEILDVALPVLFQDLGRPAQADQGVGLSGAADRTSFRAAQRIVGNPENAAALEITLGGLRFRMRGHGVMALTGAPAPISIIGSDGTRIEATSFTPVALDDGDVVTLGTPTSGMRSYLALRGGFAVEPVLGSVGVDTLAQIGPPSLKSGDRVGMASTACRSAVSLGEQPAFALPRAGETVVLDVVMGPRTDWFTDEAVEAFLGQSWTVTPAASRIGIRLDGAPLARRITGELPSEATVRGAVQVPTSGLPVLFLADHPLTGGYPVIACVAARHLDLAAQIPVGAYVRFQAIRPFEPIAAPKAAL